MSSVNTTRRGALNAAMWVRTCAISSQLQLRARLGVRRGLHDGEHGLAHLGVRHPDHGDVQHRRVQRQRVLGVAGVDVHPAGNDHERLAVGEVEPPVLVEVAEVAGGAPVVVLRVARGARLLGVVVVGEQRPVVAFEVDRAHPARGQQLTGVRIGDPHLAEPRAADRARVFQPLRRVEERDADALGGRVVLADHRAPPVDHRPLDVDRARRRGVDRHPHRRHVVALAHLGRELEHPHEHGRHPLAVRGAVALDRRQCALGVEPLHHHDRAPELLDQRREAQRRGVVERAGGEVDRLRGEAVEDGEGAPALGIVDAPLRHRRPYALRPPGGARGVEHHRARGLVGERGVGDAVEGGVVVGEALDGAAVGQPEPDLGHLRADGLGERAQRPGDDQRLGAAVAHDVGDLGRGEVVVDRREHQAAPQRGPVHLEQARGVVGQQRDAVPRRQAVLDEPPREPGRALLQVAVADRLPGARHDHGRVVGVRRRTRSGKHAGMSTGSPGVVETVTLDGRAGRQAAWTSPAP